MATLVGQSWASPSATKAKHHEESIERWWEVSAEPLLARCMRKHGWKLSFAQRCLKGYRQFMELKTVMNDWKDKQLTAPVAINTMWEEHLLDSMNYPNDCVFLFGNKIEHDPDASLDERSWLDRIKTTKIAFQARFADDMDLEVWDYREAEFGANEVNVDMFGAQNTPSGRLPVASIDAAATRANTTRYTSKAMSEDSEGDAAPRRYSRPASDARSPSPSRSRSPTRARSAASPKASTPNGNDPITIYVKDKESGDQTYFSLRYRIPFRVMFSVYAERKEIDQEKLHFTYNGQALTGFETPYSIGMEEGEHIEVQAIERR